MNYVIYSVEDDNNIGRIINLTLTKQGFTVKTFENGTDFLAAFKKEKPNLILLDIMLPDLSGKEILKQIRSNKLYKDIAIIIISAKAMAIDKVDGLDLGADDYISKPFDILELISRVNVQYRHYMEAENKIIYKNIVIEPEKMEVRKDGKLIELTRNEFAIFMMLVKAEGKVVSREEILDKLWGFSELESRTVDVHIKSLRSKIGPEFIKTVYGAGYKVF